MLIFAGVLTVLLFKKYCFGWTVFQDELKLNEFYVTYMSWLTHRLYFCPYSVHLSGWLFIDPSVRKKDTQKLETVSFWVVYGSDGLSLKYFSPVSAYFSDIDCCFQLQPPIIPKVAHDGDTKNFDMYSEDDWQKKAAATDKELEPFVDFWYAILSYTFC